MIAILKNPESPRHEGNSAEQSSSWGPCSLRVLHLLDCATRSSGWTFDKLKESSGAHALATVRRARIVGPVVYPHCWLWNTERLSGYAVWDAV